MNVWQSKITRAMVKGWSDEDIEQLVSELDDAVERIYSELEPRD